MDGCVVNLMDVLNDTQIEWMTGWMGGWVGRWVHEWMNGPSASCIGEISYAVVIVMFS